MSLGIGFASQGQLAQYDEREPPAPPEASFSGNIKAHLRQGMRRVVPAQMLFYNAYHRHFQAVAESHVVEDRQALLQQRAGPGKPAKQERVYADLWGKNWTGDQLELEYATN